jgi:hypothetical protein
MSQTIMAMHDWDACRRVDHGFSLRSCVCLTPTAENSSIKIQRAAVD